MPAESLRHAVNCMVHLCREVKPGFLVIAAVPSWGPIPILARSLFRLLNDATVAYCRIKS